MEDHLQRVSRVLGVRVGRALTRVQTRVLHRRVLHRVEQLSIRYYSALHTWRYSSSWRCWLETV